MTTKGKVKKNPYTSQFAIARRRDRKNAVDFIKRGYSGHMLDFRSNSMDPTSAKAMVRAIGYYNDFDHEAVNSAIDAVSSFVSGIAVGREGSPVIYVDIPYWTAQRATTKSKERRKYTPSERKAMIQTVIREFTHAQADEADVRPGGMVRLWWD